MTDCPNVEIRELLPAYMHGTLPVAHRSRVKGHLAECGDCAAELAALDAVRAAFAGGRPSISRPSWPHSPSDARGVSHRGRGAAARAFQIAAAVSFLALGGISPVVARSFFTGDAPMAQVDGVGGGFRRFAGTPIISFAGGVSDLQDEELEWLLWRSSHRGHCRQRNRTSCH